MTDDTALDEVDQDTAPDDAQDTPEAPEPDATREDDGKRRRRPKDASAEAAARRLQLREVTEERDQLAARVEALLRAEAERVAGRRMAVPEDLWTVGGVTLAGLLDDDGNLDSTLVEAAAAALVERRPGLATRFPDMGAGKRGPIESTDVTWSRILNGR